ncbi:MAG: cytochrome P450 [Sneathiella sp.]|uniref:cytochrome P450 n=1 Tax=Sneathiella sp. TaxID=1964365 RepID=UPI003002D3D5
MTLIEGHRPIEPPQGVAVWDIDPYDTAILTDPTDYYHELRARGPLVYIPKYQILCCGRYAEIKTIFNDWERFVSSRGVGLQDFKLDEPWRPPSIILEADPPDHTKTRTVMARAMSPRAVNQLKEFFQSTANDMVDRLLLLDSFDAVYDLAEAFPTTVFPEAVGLREVNRQHLIDYGAMVFNALGPDNALRQRSLAMGPDIVPWLTEQCRRENLKPEGLGSTIYASADNGDITEEEAGMLVRSLLSAGVDTTVTGIGSALWVLATHPEEFEKLKADPSLARPAFEETLRYTSPVHTFCRTANLDTDISGVRIQEGTKIICSLGAANLDEEHWPNADHFDINRRPTGHLALGTGIHGCVGQNIARAEAEAVLTAIALKVDKIQSMGDAIWRPNNSIHGLDSFPIKFT